MINKILNYFFGLINDNNRTENIIKHIGWSIVYKFGSTVANFFVITLTIKYLDIEKYGIWVTISSFISWFTLFDIGLGNVLRNKFAEVNTNLNSNSAQAIVSTAYFTLSGISIIIVSILILLNHYINWSNFFNTNADLQKELSNLFPFLFVFLGLQLVAKLITSIYQADQNHSIEGKLYFLVQVFSLFFIWILTQKNSSSLFLIGCISSAVPVLILIILNIKAFKGIYKALTPKLNLWNYRHFKELTNIGFNFFIIQIAAMVMFATDNFVIIKLFGPNEVTSYNIVYKYFSIVTLFYTILITPYWSSFTDAYYKKDFIWIKNSVTTIQKIWIIVPIILIVMICISDWVYDFWVGKNIKISINLSIAMAFYVAMLTFNMVYVYFINGISKIRLQFFTSLITMVINIPLSIFFGKYLGWGTTGVIISTCVCLGYSVILKPIQYFKIINKTAKGIWNK